MKEKIMETAMEAAREAGQIHKSYFGKNIKIETKSGHFDQVTESDLAAEEAIIRIIRTVFPDHNFLAEENKYEKTSSPYTWVVDPLDGTNNFAHGHPQFSVSIALAKDEEIIAGVVYDPMRDEMFCAQKGGGAFLNGTPIKASSRESLSQSILITGFYYSRDEKMLQTLDDIKNFFHAGIIGIRRFGSAAIDLCTIASGRCDGYWEFYLNPWDFAAGLIILKEAGGMITDKKENPLKLVSSYVIASNGHIHKEMMKVLNIPGERVK